jgi:DNA-damage-inducible protein J
MAPNSTKTEMVHARVDPKLKKSADRILSKVGISTAEAIRLFLRQVELHRGLPFSVSVPNEETIDAMLETNNRALLKRYRSFQDLRKTL